VTRVSKIDWDQACVGQNIAVMDAEQQHLGNSYVARINK